MKYINIGLIIVLGSLVVLVETPNRAKAQTLITQCGRVLTAPGTYVLNADLSCTSSDGIDISGNQIHLKLNSHTITGPGTSATYPGNYQFIGINVLGTCSPLPSCTVPALDHVAIEGPGMIQRFRVGIGIGYSNGGIATSPNPVVTFSQVDLVTIRNNINDIVANYVSYLTLASNVIGRSGFQGLLLENTSFSVVSQNDFSGNGYDPLQNPCASFATGVPIAGGCAGIGLGGDGMGNVVNNNTANGNSGSGIDLVGTTGTRVYGNVTNGNWAYGIFAESPNSYTIFSNSSAANRVADLASGPCTDASGDRNFWGNNNVTGDSSNATICNP